jgi:phosphoribosylpyrophosphate synthetase
LPYRPYARQDRITEDGESLSIRELAQLNQAVDTVSSSVKVSVIDPHSL